MSKYFVTGIGTDVGKTVISALITKALSATYWKPVQAGLEEKDEDAIRKIYPEANILPSVHYLKAPMSPHAAARLENVEIDLSVFKVPEVEGNLIVEGAGGIMVPLNDKETILDLIKQLGLKVIVVSRNYLGSINHTLLTLDMLKMHGVAIEGIIFNGDKNVETETFIKNYSDLNVIAYIGEEKEFNDHTSANYISQIQMNLK